MWLRLAVTAIDIFAIEKYWQHIESLDYKVTADTQAVMMTRLTRLLRRVRLAGCCAIERRGMAFAEAQNVFVAPREIIAIRKMFPQKLPPDFQAHVPVEKFEGLVAAGVPQRVSLEDITRCEFLFPATSFVDISQASRARSSQQS